MSRPAGSLTFEISVDSPLNTAAPAKSEVMMTRNVRHCVRFSQTGAVGARPDGNIGPSLGDTRARCQPYSRGHQSPGIPQAPARLAEPRTPCARNPPFLRSHAVGCARNRVRNMYRCLDMVWRFRKPLATSSRSNRVCHDHDADDSTRSGGNEGRSVLHRSGYGRMASPTHCPCSARRRRKDDRVRSGRPRSHAGATESWRMPNVHSSFCSRCIVVVRV